MLLKMFFKMEKILDENIFKMVSVSFFFNVNTSVLGADPEGIAAPKTFKATWK